MTKLVMGIATLLAAAGPLRAQGTWSTKADMTVAATDYGRSDHAAVATGGYLYVFGGDTDNVGMYVNQMMRYNPLTDAWDLRATFQISPNSWALATGAAFGGNVYQFGGRITYTGSAYVNNTVWNAEAWRYDTAANIWVQLTDLPEGRGLACAVATAQEIFVLGGVGPALNGTVESKDTNYRFDPAGNGGLGSWSTSTPLPADVYGLAGGLVNGQIYVAGGGYVTSSSNGYSFIAAIIDNVRRFNPANPGAGWSTMASMPDETGGAAAAVLGNRLFTFGDSAPPQSVVYEYDPAFNAWRSMAAMNPARGDTAAAAITIDGAERILIAGGRTWGAADPLKDLLVFTPPAAFTPPVNPPTGGTGGGDSGGGGGGGCSAGANVGGIPALLVLLVLVRRR